MVHANMNAATKLPDLIITLPHTHAIAVNQVHPELLKVGKTCSPMRRPSPVAPYTALGPSAAPAPMLL